MPTPLENVQPMLGDSGATGSVTGGTVVAKTGTVKSFVSTVTGSGAVAATVTIQASADGSVWTTQITQTLSGTNADSKIDSIATAMPFWRAVTSGVSGTGATVKTALSGD